MAFKLDKAKWQMRYKFIDAFVFHGHEMTVTDLIDLVEREMWHYYLGLVRTEMEKRYDDVKRHFLR